MECLFNILSRMHYVIAIKKFKKIFKIRSSILDLHITITLQYY